MAVVFSRKIEQLSRATDPKKGIIEAAGDLSGIEIMFNHILVGTYIRPERTAGGIIRPTENLKEDEYQGKVGLILKKGPMAFLDDDSNQFHGQNIEVGDWIVYRIGDGWSIHINGSPCRVLADNSIRMKIQKPDLVF